MNPSVAWDHEVQSWLESFPRTSITQPVGACACGGRADRSSERKSLQPIVARVAPADDDHDYSTLWPSAPAQAGTVRLVWNWGRIGTKGQELV